MTRVAVIYHDCCPDGYTAAWVADGALEGEDLEITFHPASYGTPTPYFSTEPEEWDPELIYILDFAYPHDTLVELTDGGRRRVVVLDHHRTAINDLVPHLWNCSLATAERTDFHADKRGPYEVLLDVGRSGAGITWDYFYPGIPRPPIVDYVEDRDLWRFALPYSAAVSAFIRCQPHTFSSWDKTAKMDVDQMAEAGKGVLLHIEAYCRAAANHAYWCEMGGRRFPICNVTYESCSEVADYLMTRFGVDMAGYFFQRHDGLWQYGFRSRNAVTVNDFAEGFGGGGHEKASGCQGAELLHVRAPDV